MPLLGELEGAVLDVLWKQENPLRVRQVLEALTSDRELAYTTVMTVLDRLAKKSLVLREQANGERAWVYRPALSRARLIADEVSGLLAEAGDDRDEVIRLVCAGLPPRS